MRKINWRRRLLPFAFWSIPALLLSTLAAREGHRSMVNALILEGMPFFFWALVTPGIIDLARRYPPATLKTLRGFARHLGTALACGLICALIAGLAFAAIRTEDIKGPLLYFLLTGFAFWSFFGLLFYTMVVSVGFTIAAQEAVRERERTAAQLEARLVEAQLSALRMQLHPHFLFNALNTVAMHVREGDRDTSVRLITRLSELLRHLLDDSAGQEIPLRTELQQIARYLEIESARFSDRLQVDIDVPDALGAALVPNFVLQPLVENAIRHGISARAAAGRLAIRALREDGRLVIDVSNDGPQLANGFTIGQSRGVGLRNTQMRLQHLYGPAGTLTMTNRDGMVSARVTLPYRSSDEP